MNLKTAEPGKVTFFVLLLATRDSGGSDYSPPPSVCVSLMTLTLLCHLNQLPPDSSLYFLCLHLLHPLCCLSAFFWLTLPRVEGNTFQVSLVSDDAHPLARETLTNQDFPSPFPQVTASHEALILKRHFWKVGHQLPQALLGLNRICLSKQYYFCLATDGN